MTKPDRSLTFHRFKLRTDNRPDFPEGELQEYDQKADIGLTARWGLTPNLKLSAAVNPDFSQV
jgi:hypothetical protein